ncbi:MAG TPA: insulinase family protein [Candidatus Coprenecus stercoravium]|uniref:Insulinase family protein n=1 Tax=Candidatus Coprenecus stercoravium TaxID=2840735 RepID=A0A9D2GRV3_9BACT|nr:insulinase family protein [Candidatus Coprenecus stercoravium]
MKRIILLLIILMSSVGTLCARFVGVLEDDARIVRDTMPNGLVYYIVGNTSVSGYADFSFIQRSGVAMEDSATRGMTYLMECMALTETVNFPDGSIFSFVDDMGLDRRDGLVIDAGDYYTTYTFSNVPVSKNASMVDSMLLAMYNMSSALIVNDRSVNRGKNFFKNMYSSGQTLEKRIEDSLARRYFAGTPLAPLSQEELFARVDGYTTEDVRSFHRLRCRPDMQAIVIAGDIDPLSVESKIRALFQVIPKPAGPLPVFRDSILEAAGGGWFYFADREADRVRITFDYIAPPLDTSLRSTAVPFVYNYISGVAMDIMDRRLRDALGYAPFYAISAEAGIVPYLNRISYRLGIECAPEDYKEAYALVLGEIERLLRDGVSEEEFRRSSEDFILGLNDMYSRRSSMDNKYYRDLCVANFTDGYVMAGIELYKSYIEAAGEVVDSSTVYKFLKSVFQNDSSRTVVCSSPERTGGLEYVEAVISEGVREDPALRHVERSALVSLIDRGRFVNKSTGVVSRRMPNGATVACRRVGSEPGWVYFDAVARGGLSLSGDSLAVLRKFVNDVARISVTGGLDMYQMERLQRNMHMTLDRTVSVGSRKISGKFRMEDLEAFLDMVAVYFEGSEPDYETFGKYRRMMENSAPYALNSPERVFGALCGKDIRSVSGDLLNEETDISGLDYDSALGFVNMLFSNAAEFTFIFVGDFEEDDLLRSVYGKLSGLPGRRAVRSRTESRNFYIASYDAVEEVTVPMVSPRRLYSCKLTVPSESNIEDRMLSEITGKVIEREVIRRLSLRGILADAQRRFHSYPKEVMTVEFQFRTYREVKDADDIFADILVDLAERGVNSGEVEGIRRNMELKNDLRESRSSSYWKSVLLDRYVRRKDYYTRRQEAMDSVTAEDVNEELMRVLDDGRLSVLSVEPE